MTITIDRGTSLQLDHVPPSWYTPRPGDFGYVFGDVAGASTSGGTFGTGAQEYEDDKEKEEDDEDDDNDESDD